MTNTEFITNIFSLNPLYSYETQRFWQRRMTFGSIRLYQKCLRTSLVKRAIDRLQLFIDKRLILVSNDQTIQIQEIHVSL